uniref:5-demethoxyubiquinone hydroxylase, mitochondrial n=1 Tax=Camelus bactrianus TaxID=9837 RepID=A0A9W3GDW5_CAMBA|nr:5-demethoxyubiquinone hydroxylase, mitochondrial isoform X2 [Camelus bactrianus]
MSYPGATAARSLRRLRVGGPRPLSAYGRKISVRFCSSGMTLDNINRAAVDRIIRVDHAGEYGANRIYAGQMAVLGRTSVGPVIQKMWDQEKDHLKKFNELMVAFRVRPTVLMPFWNVMGFALGAGTALLGKAGAMACTVAVEESIAHHYNNQIRTLMEEEPEKYQELLQVIRKFRDEELEHHDIGLEHDAELISLLTQRSPSPARPGLCLTTEGSSGYMPRSGIAGSYALTFQGKCDFKIGHHPKMMPG